MILLAIKLFLAHLIGDFVLQPTHWVKHKKEHKHKSIFLYLHGAVHLLVLLVVLGFNLKFLPLIILVVGSHILIDILKVNLEAKLNPSKLFALDQFLHLAVIALAVYFYNPFQIEFDQLFTPQNILLISALVFITFCSSIVIQVIMSNWQLEDVKGEDSLKNAGKYIGILERLFIFVFILLNQWAAIGFLITAKSVFRFNDLTRSKDRKLTEYILIGTLTSFGLAILTGIIYNYLITII